METICFNNHDKVKKIYTDLCKPDADKKFNQQIKLLQDPESFAVLTYLFNVNWENYRELVDRLKLICIRIRLYKFKHELIENFICTLHKRLSKINTANDLANFIQKLIKQKDLFKNVRLFYCILSSKSQCITLLRPEKITDKYHLNNILKNKTYTLNDLKHIITGISNSETTDWESSGAKSMFELLRIIGKHYGNPLKKVGISFRPTKVVFSHKKIIDEWKKKYGGKGVRSIKGIFDTMRNDKKDLMYIVPYVFKIIYPRYSLKNTGDKNNEIGAMCYILYRNGYVKSDKLFKK